ncbi:hypothetical protein DsansV1_C03g0031911 [Dioscorea sansibarensis]
MDAGEESAATGNGREAPVTPWNANRAALFRANTQLLVFIRYLSILKASGYEGSLDWERESEESQLFDIAFPTVNHSDIRSEI